MARLPLANASPVHVSSVPASRVISLPVLRRLLRAIGTREDGMKQNTIAYLGPAACSALAWLACSAKADPAPATRDTTIVVTATRTDTPLEQVASSVTVITARQLQATHRPFVLDALREVPGVYVSQTGGPGRRRAPCPCAAARRATRWC